MLPIVDVTVVHLLLFGDRAFDTCRGYFVLLLLLLLRYVSFIVLVVVVVVVDGIVVVDTC
jgi:hypothetical protein